MLLNTSRLLNYTCGEPSLAAGTTFKHRIIGGWRPPSTSERYDENFSPFSDSMKKDKWNFYNDAKVSKRVNNIMYNFNEQIINLNYRN